MNDSLIELIYESAFFPELWDKVLDQLAGIADAAGGALCFPGSDELRGKASDSLQSLSREESVILSRERDYARGPLERTTLDKLHPHLMRTALIASRLRLERARLATETLALLGQPALVVDLQCRVLAANDLIQANTNFLRWLATDRIALRDRSAENLLKEALKRLSGNAAAGKHSFPACGREGEDRLLVHVIPLMGRARDIFGGGAALIVLSPIRPPAAPSLGLIQALFGLSPREARVAQGLARGATLDEIAEEAKVSRNTVRSQLRVVLEKTGCNRQAEVAVLLSRLALSADFS